MSSSASLIGISVGPGAPELITVKGVEALRRCDVLFTPQAKGSDESVARRIVERYQLPDEKFRPVLFEMNRDREHLRDSYRRLAEEIAVELDQGREVGFLTLGDAMTYSTWIYTLEAVRHIRSDCHVETIPGVSSFAAVAAATEWPLGEQKERLLILPCPEEMSELRMLIEEHDVVILMKIGKRMPGVLGLLGEMGILDLCSLGHRVGMPGGEVRKSLGGGDEASDLGYFSTMLIRRSPLRVT